MKWNRTFPKVNDIRYKHKFAYFPRTINIAKHEQQENFITIWLEHYYAKQILLNGYSGLYWHTCAYILEKPIKSNVS